MVQSNLVNSESWGLEILFRSMKSLNYREIGIHVIMPSILKIRSRGISSLDCMCESAIILVAIQL